jgi:hypothetical protein
LDMDFCSFDPLIFLVLNFIHRRSQRCPVRVHQVRDCLQVSLSLTRVGGKKNAPIQLFVGKTAGGKGPSVVCATFGFGGKADDSEKEAGLTLADDRAKESGAGHLTIRSEARVRRLSGFRWSAWKAQTKAGARDGAKAETASETRTGNPHVPPARIGFFTRFYSCFGVLTTH